MTSEFDSKDVHHELQVRRQLVAIALALARRHVICVVDRSIWLLSQCKNDTVRIVEKSNKIRLVYKTKTEQRLQVMLFERSRVGDIDAAKNTNAQLKHNEERKRIERARAGERDGDSDSATQTTIQTQSTRRASAAYATASDSCATATACACDRDPRLR